MPTGATRIAAPQPSWFVATRAGSAAWWNSQSDFTLGWTHFVHRSISRPTRACATLPLSAMIARATAIVRSVSSVVSAMRHSRFRLPTYRGMIDPGVPSKPLMPSGYQRNTSSCDSNSVCLPMASPVAIPLRQPTIRSVIVTVDCGETARDRANYRANAARAEAAFRHRREGSGVVRLRRTWETADTEACTHPASMRSRSRLRASGPAEMESPPDGSDNARTIMVTVRDGMESALYRRTTLVTSPRYQRTSGGRNGLSSRQQGIGRLMPANRPLQHGILM